MSNMALRVSIPRNPQEKIEQRMAELERLIQICQDYGYGETYTRPYVDELNYLAVHEYAVLDLAA